jgi:hypothetical protein
MGNMISLNSVYSKRCNKKPAEAGFLLTEKRPFERFSHPRIISGW